MLAFAQESREHRPASAVIVMASIVVWMTVQAGRVAAGAATE